MGACESIGHSPRHLVNMPISMGAFGLIGQPWLGFGFAGRPQRNTVVSSVFIVQ